MACSDGRGASARPDDAPPEEKTKKTPFRFAFHTLIRIFANMNNFENTDQWCENVMVIDGDYADSVAFNLIVNFERMLGRRIPPADLPQWIDCLALDGGLREGSHETSVVFIHDKQHARLDNFTPGNYADELHQKAFKDSLGEFAMAAYPTEEGLVEQSQFVLDVVRAACARPEVKRLMIVADTERHYDALRQTLRQAPNDDKRITVFAMQPMPGGNFRQEILGYSLMAALGIKGEEIERM